MEDGRDSRNGELFSSGTLKAREDVVARQVDDEWVLYDPLSEKMHVLNVTAGLIWNHLDGTQTLSELVALTRKAFDPPASEEVAAHDVRTVLAQFSAEGLLA